MLIRAVKRSEIVKIVPLFINSFSESPYSENWESDQAMKRLTKAFMAGREFCLLAEENGRIVGFAFSRVQAWDDGLHVFIEDFAVDPKYRNKGIGSMLVGKIEELARAKGFTAINLTANFKSDAMSFWKKQGYSPDGYIQMKKRL